MTLSMPAGQSISRQVSPELLDSRARPNVNQIEDGESPQSMQTRRADQAYDAYVAFHRLKEIGTAPGIEEYCNEFPSIRSSLLNLLNLDKDLEDNPQLLDETNLIAWPTAGSDFGRFRLLDMIGQGGFAHVYLAADRSLGDRTVVLKISMTRSPEAQLLGPISHPNVVSVYSTHEDRDSGLVAVCMPYVGSATLQTVLNAVQARQMQHASEILAAVRACDRTDLGANLPASPVILKDGSYIDGICQIAAQIADGLAHIHARGICHRDLKPSNILVRSSGVPMLLDFNLSTGVATDMVQVAGTIPYMAPELLRELQEYPHQTFASPGKQADFYALGVILYLLCTGKHPFGSLHPDTAIAEQCSVLLKRQGNPPTDPSALNPAVDRRLSQLIRRCLSPNPADRPTTAAELASALRSRFSWPRRIGASFARRPGLAAGALFVTLALAVATGGQIANRPAYKDRCYTQGIAYCAKGDFTEAIKQFNEAIANGLEGPAPFIARAAAYQRLADREPTYLQNALADLREADSQAPSGQAKAGMAYCLVRMQQFQPSIVLGEEAMKLGYDNAETHANLGYGLLRLGNYEEAKTQLDFALQKKPNLRPALHARATVGYTLALMASGKITPKAKDTPELRELRHAIDCMEKAQKLGDDSPEGSYLLARLHALGCRVNKNEKADVLQHLRAAMEAGGNKNFLKDIVFAQFQNDREFSELAKIDSKRIYAPATCYCNPLEEFVGK